MISTAALSDDGVYRYDLVRRWAAGDTCLWVMLNPSTADAMADDPTIRRCVSFARRWGFQAIRVVNLFALRATDPAQLHEDPVRSVGPENTKMLEAAIKEAPLIVVGWGAHDNLYGWDACVWSYAREAGKRLMCLGRTKSGAPKHPLYLRQTTELEVWEP